MVVTNNIKNAAPDDLTPVSGLLAESGLPADGVADAFPTGYAVIEEAGVIAGCAGVETYGRYGLLRSVAIRPASRGRGAGDRLVRDRLRWARSHELDALYLLTTTAARFFRRQGFQAIPRSAVPAAIRESLEFRSVCPESAAVMYLDLRNTESENK